MTNTYLKTREEQREILKQFTELILVQIIQKYLSGELLTWNSFVTGIYPQHKMIPSDLSGFSGRSLQWQNGN